MQLLSSISLLSIETALTLVKSQCAKIGRKFDTLGKFLKPFAKFWEASEILNLLCQIVFNFGQFCFTVNGQILNKLSSHLVTLNYHIKRNI